MTHGAELKEKESRGGEKTDGGSEEKRCRVITWDPEKDVIIHPF